LLIPADFGLVAVATAYLTLVQGLSTLNVGQALIKLRREDRPILDAAWTLSVLRGALLTALLLASSSAVAAFVGDDRVAPLLLAMSLFPLIGGLANPKFASFERDFHFSPSTTVNVATKLVGIAVTIGVALTLRSYWAIVAGAFAGTVVRTLLSFAMKPYLPRVSLSHARPILRFAGWVTLANALNTLSTALDNLVIARFLGVRDAGFYSMTRQVAALPNDTLLGPTERVLFAGFSQIANEPTRLNARVREVVGMTASIAVPITIGLALVAAEFVPLILGNQWIDCVPFLQLILPFFAVSMAVTSANPAAMAVGATRDLFSTALYFAALRLPIFIGCIAYFGLIGAMYALALVSVLSWILNFRLLNAAASITFRQLITAVNRPAISAVMMAAAVSVVPQLVAASSPSWELLAAKIALGATVYIAVHVTLWLVEGRPLGVETRTIQLLRSLRTPSAHAD
jgi:PST family polysaccharide transporter